jgi:hypothetical protein
MGFGYLNQIELAIAANGKSLIKGFWISMEQEGTCSIHYG